MNLADSKRKQFEMIIYSFYTLILWNFGRKIEDNGLAYFIGTILLVGLAWSLIGMGTRDSLSRMIRYRLSRGQYKNNSNMIRNLTVSQFFVGLLGTIVVFFSSNIFSEKIVLIPYASLLMKAIAPFIALHAIVSIIEGCLLGYKSLRYLNLLQIIRGILVFVMGNIFQKSLQAYGEKVSDLLIKPQFTQMYGAFGLCIALVLSEFLLIIIGLFFVAAAKKRLSLDLTESKKVVESFGNNIAQFVQGRMPVGLCGLIESVVIILMTRQIALSNLENPDEALFQLGGFLTGYIGYGILCSAIACVWLIPMAHKAVVTLKKHDYRYAKNIFEAGIHLAIVIGLFWSIFMMVLSDAMETVLGIGKDLVGESMKTGAFSMLAIIVALYMIYVFKLLDGPLLSFMALLLGAIGYKLFVTFGGKGMDVFRLNTIGLLIMSIITVLVLALFAFKRFKASINLMKNVIFPVGGGAVIGLLFFFCAKVLQPHLGPWVTLLIGFFAIGIIYIAILLMLRNLEEETLKVIPFGKYILALGDVLGVF